MAFVTRCRACRLVFSLVLISGCAYGVSGTQGVSRPEKIRTLQRIAIAPFRYSSDWTGLFRDIYRRAGLKVPEGRKIESIEGTFLIRDAIAAKGYEAVALRGEWKGGALGDSPRPGGKVPKALLRSLRDAGAGAVMLAGGGRRCGDVDSCAATVRVLLLDVGTGEELWRSEGRAATVLSQGDEMRAAVQGAFAAFPDKASRSR